MPVVKLRNLECRNAFRYPQDIENLLNYVARPNATEYPLESNHYLIGAAPDIFLTDQPDAAIRTTNLLYRLNELYPHSGHSLMLHYIVSFGKDERTDPEMAFSLGQEIVRYYFDQGYISFFGVHTDTDNIHIHIAISTINWKNGRTFWLYDNLSKLQNGVAKWYQRYIDGNKMPLFTGAIEEFEEGA